MRSATKKLSEDSAFVRCFGAALGIIWRCSAHDRQMVQHLMSATNITLKHFKEAGVAEHDLKDIHKALKRGAPLADKQRSSWGSLRGRAYERSCQAAQTGPARSPDGR